MATYPGIREDNHAEKRKRKQDKVEGLEALLEMHEKAAKPDHEHIRKLKFKLRFARTQLQHMRP